MPSKNHFAQLFFLLSLLFSSSAVAQYSLRGFDLDGDILQWYDQKLGEDKSGIVNGEYIEIQRQSRDSHQFFDKDQWLLNSIMYRGERYDSIYLRYDVERDVVLIRHPTNYQYHSQPIKLIQSEVEWFNVSGHFFRRRGPILNFAEGFFDELYNGNQVSLLSKRIKTTETSQTLNYVSEDKLILRVNDQYHRVRRKGSVLKLFKPHKQQIKSFIKQNNLNINPDNEPDFITLAEYCDKLTSEQKQP